MIKSSLEEISNKEIDSSNFETEDFIDTIELVFMKVMNTKSVFKIERFKNIIVNQILEPETEHHLFRKYIYSLFFPDYRHTNRG